MTKLSHEKIPYFNAPIYLENKTQIGKVDEIFGPINESVSINNVLICFFFVFFFEKNLFIQDLTFCCDAVLFD